MRRPAFRPHWRDPVGAENAGQVGRREPETRYSRTLLDETKAVWQPYYKKRLTDEDAREIIENMVSFLSILSDHRASSGTPTKSAKIPARDED